MSKKHLALMAGVAREDITPPLGFQLAGDIGRFRPVESVRHPLYARALVLEASGARACLIQADVTLIMRRWSDRIRRAAADFLGIEPDAVIVHATQSHSASSIGSELLSDSFPPVSGAPDWLRCTDDNYNERFVSLALEAVRAAARRLTPVSMRAVRSMDGRISFNRRFILRDGTARTHPALCAADILCPEGVVDPEVGLLTFEAAGKTIAALAHHTCHPVHGYPYRYVCPDWPGLWAEAVSERLGGDCVTLAVNGACGNIHHTNHLDPGYTGDVERYVTMISETTDRIIPDLTSIFSTPMTIVSEAIRLPLREISSDDLARAEDLVAEHPEPMWTDETKTNINWDWVYALSLVDLARRRAHDPTYEWETQALRLGDFVLVGWPGEPFVEAQLEVKKRSPATHTFVAHGCNDGAGYVPTVAALGRGGYETHVANWSKLCPEALDTITDQTQRLVKELFQSSAGASGTGLRRGQEGRK